MHPPDLENPANRSRRTFHGRRHDGAAECSVALSVVPAKTSSNSKGRIFLIGASAIELHDLVELLRELPPAFGGPLLVAVHSFADGDGGSPLELLSQAATLKCAYAKDGEEI